MKKFRIFYHHAGRIYSVEMMADSLEEIELKAGKMYPNNVTCIEEVK